MGAKLGIITETTYSVCRLVDFRKDADAYLSTWMSVTDQATDISAFFMVLVTQREFLELAKGCYPNLSMDRIMANHTARQQANPFLKLFCVDGLPMDAIGEFMMADLNQLDIPTVRIIRNYLIDGVAKCLRG